VKVRVLTILAERWGAALGGRERYLFDLAGHVAGAGIPVRVFAPRGQDERVGVVVETRRRFDARVARDGPVLAAMPVAFATHVQLHGGLLRDAFEAERDAMVGVRKALFRPALRLNARRQELLRGEAAMLTGADRPRVMVWSEAVRRAVTAAYGVPADEIVVTPPGVDLRVFCPESSRAPSDRLLFVAHNPRLKGLRFAIAAARKAGRELVVAGKRSPTGRPRAGVTFTGPLDAGALVRLYRSSAALLHPTFHDPFSIACLEALACGCPVLTTRRNGLAERLESGRHGFLVDDPRDVDGLVQAIRVLPSVDRGEVARFGATFGFEDHAETVLAWLSSSTGSASRR